MALTPNPIPSRRPNPSPLQPPPGPVDLYESHSGDMVAIFEELELPADEALKHRPSLDTTPQKFGGCAVINLRTPVKPPRTTHEPPTTTTNHPF